MSLDVLANAIRSAAAGGGCEELRLLDVNPVLSNVRPMTADVEARFVFAFRRGHLD